MLCYEVINKPLSPEQAHVKGLNDQAERLKAQAKQARAQQRVQEARVDLARTRAPIPPRPAT